MEQIAQKGIIWQYMFCAMRIYLWRKSKKIMQEKYLSQQRVSAIQGKENSGFH